MALLEVACAIIEHEGLTLVVQRSAGMKQGLLWEFPGGKLEPGEDAWCPADIPVVKEYIKKLSQYHNGK